MSKKKDMNLASLFKNVITMSGTPDWVQQEMTAKNKENECKCSPKLAMENGWICKPFLNLVNCTESSWPAAVKAVFERELEIWEANGKIFRPALLVNCKSIDEVHNLRSVDWFKENAGKLFHLISIHSKKSVHDHSTGSRADLCAEIDGKQVDAEEAYDEIVKIDEHAGDTLPVIVFQVQMIGEGINVKSFNSVITASNCDKTAMQQIGRAVRNFSIQKLVAEKHEQTASSFWKRILGKKDIIEKKTLKTFTKVNDGHANVYVINDNLKTLESLVVGLSNYDLTSDCFDWGKRIDIDSGSSPEILDEADSAKLQKSSWLPLDGTLPEIIEVMSGARKRILTSCFDKFLDGSEDNDGNGIPDIEELRELLLKKQREGWTEVWTGRKTLPSPHDILDNFKQRVSKLLDDKHFRTLWTKSRRAALGYAMQDPEMAEFLETHLNQKTLDTVVMT